VEKEIQIIIGRKPILDALTSGKELKLKMVDYHLHSSGLFLKVIKNDIRRM